jgi:hypothetical protein
MYISLTIFLFRSGIAFYFHLFSTVQVTARPKKNVCLQSDVQKNLGSVSIIIFIFFSLSAKLEIVVSESDSGVIWYFEPHGKLNLVSYGILNPMVN